MTKKRVFLIALIVFVSIGVVIMMRPKFQQSTQDNTTSIKNTDDINTVSGYVIGGGDTTQEMLLDAPRIFVFEVRRDNGSIVKVTYTAYPPSPYGDKQRKKIRLNFHAGTVLIGDYLTAHGSYEQNTNMLVVAEEGDYIETFPTKP
jgi:hypothetical protein